jgi:putative transcriptional regulator
LKISYKKLWHLLIDRGLNKQDLRRMTGISTASIAKLGKGENITTDTLVKMKDARQKKHYMILKQWLRTPTSITSGLLQNLPRANQYMDQAQSQGPYMATLSCHA